MLKSVRELVHPQKSWTLTTCDIALRPLHMVLKNAPIALQECGLWEQCSKVASVAELCFACIAALCFAPFILAALIYKSESSEHRRLMQNYQIFKKKKFFQENNYRLLHVKESGHFFTFKMQHADSGTIIQPQFDWSGKCRYKNLYVV